MLDLVRSHSFTKSSILGVLFLLLMLWVVVTPRNKPPGTAFQIQLDPVYRPIGGRLIMDKSRSASALIQSRNAFERPGFSYAPRRMPK